MYAWYIHLAVAKRINELLKMEENSFYVGTLISMLDKKQDKKAINFQKKVILNEAKVMLPSYEDYIKKYKDKFDNPIYMGYLVHLMIVYYFNKYVFSNYWVVENKIIVGAKLNNGNIKYGDMSSRRRLRINDYEVFNDSIKRMGGYGIPVYSEEVYENAKSFKLINIEKDDIFTICESTNTPLEKGIVNKIFRKKYKLFTKDTIAECYEGCISFISEYLKENIL